MPPSPGRDYMQSSYDDQKNLEADVSPEVKSYTEEEVKQIANEVANKNYYKGLDEGTKKIKLELENVRFNWMA